MPSFLTDENTPIYSQSGGILDFKPDQHHLGVPSKEQKSANVKPPNRLPPSPPSHARTGSFADSSSHSTHTDLSDSRSQRNGSATRPTSMSSVTNGKPARGASVSSTGELDSSPDRFQTEQFPSLANGNLPNGSLEFDDGKMPQCDANMNDDSPFEAKQHIPTSLPAQPHRRPPRVPSVAPPEPPSREPPRTPTAPESNPAMNGDEDNDESNTAAVAKNQSSTSESSAAAGLAPLETIPSGAPLSGLGTPNSSTTLPPTTPNTIQTEDQRNSHSTHRFSSPPIYQHPNGAASTSTSALHPPHNAGLKHRHTLEVPKVTPGRGSRDGAESAYASGRFSPTATGRRPSLSLGRKNTRSLQSDMVRDEVVPDEDALRWAEAYRQKRAKKKHVEDEDRVLVGTKVDENHQNWVTAYNMLTGIRVSVSRTNAKLDRELTDQDFEAKQKSTFDMYEPPSSAPSPSNSSFRQCADRFSNSAGNELVPSAKYDFKFKDYAPWVFRNLRTKFKLDPADYLMSLTGKYILSELGSPGKSGSFFYFSRDYKYIIKTIHHAEHKFLRKILKDYYQHVLDNPNTLLSQFYGLHRVKMPWGKKIHFVVMNNLFPPHRDIHMTFDLKGSTVGRDYREEDIESHPRATLKDLNWMRRKRTLELGMQKKRLFLEQLQRDVRLLQRLEIMDYSLLIGIHDLERGNEENLRDKTLRVFNPGGEDPDPANDPHTVLMRTPSKLENEKKARELRHMIKSEKPIPMGLATEKMPDTLDEPRKHSVFYSDDGGFGATHENNGPATEVYYLGVIDCLTHYGVIKKIEHFWKGLSSDSSQISALPPQEYGERFYQFIEGVTMSQEVAARARFQQEEAEVAAAAEREQERVSSWSSSVRRRSNSGVPPAPSHNPPPPPPAGNNEAVRKVNEEASRTQADGRGEGELPDRTLTTHREAPNGAQAILPVVEEAAESSASARSRAGSSGRSFTPSRSMDAPDRPPPTPPKFGQLGLRNTDSGYADRVKPQPSRESLEKALPPLPQAKA
ncbi:hypothetical protein MKZ38_005868 [Zalerion maritima]|uniref:PIPK domain-containing protein n=1 Tax=Zalerion maritima TaxID=339359 RepID=A0AAD5RPY6_9PEZI|nr:hypothetical protein MKZ38_005868 [Zalerion maritima]